MNKKHKQSFHYFGYLIVNLHFYLPTGRSFRRKTDQYKCQILLFYVTIVKDKTLQLIVISTCYVFTSNWSFLVTTNNKTKKIFSLFFSCLTCCKCNIFLVT